ncbi:MAG: response regulator [Cetobacterium sp.]|uniref:response regulator n=1 Tax=Cetobacterium sp. TaxID=2071632 RepID=UPI002FC67002
MKKVLIVDDSEDICFAVSEFFKYKGWEVKSVGDVEKALDIIRSEKFDVILIDYNMPYINGVVGVKLIRQLDKEVPIIALTVECEESVAEDFFKSGANDFAIKPIKMLDLYFRINVHTNTTYKLKEEVDYPKGIDKNTLGLILDCLKKERSYLSVEGISDITGVASKTVNRYLNYMCSQNKVILNVIYGKIGRPKKEYKLK